MSPADLRAWRLALGWTQARAAAALGLSRRALVYYETGDRRRQPGGPAVPELVALAVEGLTWRRLRAQIAARGGQAAA